MLLSIEAGDPVKFLCSSVSSEELLETSLSLHAQSEAGLVVVLQDRVGLVQASVGFLL